MGEKIRYLGCQDLGAKEIVLIKSMLRLFDGKTQGRWQFAEQQPFDALLVPDSRSATSDENAETEHDTLFIRTALPHTLSEAPNTEERRTNDDFVLRPIRALNLLEKLNRIGELLDLHDTQASVRAHGWDDTREWRDVLHEWRGNVESYMVETTLCKFVIFPLSRRFLCEKADAPIREIASARIQSFQPIPPERAAHILRVKKTASLSLLAWHAALYSSHSELLPEFSAGQSFRLRRWPDFGSLDHDPVHIPLAGLLSQRVLNLHELQRSGNFPAEHLHRFLNAALLTGYLEFTQAKTLSWLFGRRSENAAERLSLFGKIRSKLGI